MWGFEAQVTVQNTAFSPEKNKLPELVLLLLVKLNFKNAQS